MSNAPVPAPNLIHPRVRFGDVFCHYKGTDLYRVVGVARDHEDKDTLVVVYQRIEGGTCWTRPLDSFASHVPDPNDTVNLDEHPEHEPKLIPRFKRVGQWSPE